MLHHGFYYEEVVRYQVPVKARQLRVCAWLDRVSMFSGRQFEAWHGVNAEKLGLWQGRARSNTLIVDKKP
jgi:hypothetical protein